MAGRIVWTVPAVADRAAIFSYIADDNIRAAVAIDEKIGTAAERLTHMPFKGRPGRVPGTRELVVHEHYMLVYEIDGDTVYILTVLHTGRQWPPVSDA